MATTVNRDTNAQTAEDLNRYVIDRAAEWQEPIKKSLQLETILTAENGVVYTENTYSEDTRKMEGVVQAYQGRFTPKGDIVIGSHANKILRMKSDLQYDEEQMDTFWDSKYPQYEGSVNASFEDNPFIQDFLGEFYFNQWQREMDMVSVKGVATPVVAGTPTSVLGSIDGFDKVFNDLIAAGKLNTIATGVITEQNIVAVVQATLASLDPDFYDESINIYMSPTHALWFSRAYKAMHPYAGLVGDGMNQMKKALYVDDFNATIHSIKAMRGSQRFWIDVKVDGKSNMIVLKHKKKSDMPTLTFVPQIRGIQAKADWHRGYGLRRYEYTFVTKVA